MTPILSSTKMIQQLANPLFKQDLVKKHEFYQCIYPILDDLYIPDKSYHDPHPPYFSIINDHYGYQEDDPMTPERYEFETTEAYYRIRQYKKELAMLCNETEKNMAMRNHDPYLSDTEFRQFVLLRYLRNLTINHLKELGSRYPFTSYESYLEIFNDKIVDYLYGMSITFRKIGEPEHVLHFLMDVNSQKVIKFHEIDQQIVEQSVLQTIDRLDIINTLIELNLFDWHTRYEAKQIDNRIEHRGQADWHLHLYFTKRKNSGFDVYGSETVPWNFVRLANILKAN